MKLEEIRINDLSTMILKKLKELHPEYSDIFITSVGMPDGWEIEVGYGFNTAGYDTILAGEETLNLEPVAILHDITQAEWYGFAGASKFKDGSLPLYYYNNVILIVADPSGIEIYLEEDEDHGQDVYTIDSSKEMPKRLVELMCKDLIEELKNAATKEEVKAILLDSFGMEVDSHC